MSTRTIRKTGSSDARCGCSDVDTARQNPTVAGKEAGPCAPAYVAAIAGAITAHTLSRMTYTPTVDGGPGQREYQEGARVSKARLPLIGAVLLGGVLLATAIPRGTARWTTVGKNRSFSISGLALVRSRADGVDLLIVHDNKGAKEPRLATVAIGAGLRYTPLPWPTGRIPPADIESVTALPHSYGQFLISTSTGVVSVLAIQDGRVSVQGTFVLPDLPATPMIEGLSVQSLDGVPIAAWGHRGGGAEPGRLYWGVFDAAGGTMTHVSQIDVRVPYPMTGNPNTRHISDLRIAVDGRVWSLATNDPGERGPFESALYNLGVLRVTGNGVTFEPTRPLVPIQTFRRKVEAIELLDAGARMALGTDDELAGGAIRIEALPIDAAP